MPRGASFVGPGDEAEQERCAGVVERGEAGTRWTYVWKADVVVAPAGRQHLATSGDLCTRSSHSISASYVHGAGGYASVGLDGLDYVEAGVSAGLGASASGGRWFTLMTTCSGDSAEVVVTGER